VSEAGNEDEKSSQQQSLEHESDPMFGVLTRAPGCSTGLR
jgi:hypothetical protein